MIRQQKLLLPAAIWRKKLGMTISKLSCVLCALALGAISFSARAEDNPAQAAARLALAKQLFEESAQNATNAPAMAVAPAAPVAVMDTNVVMQPMNSKESKAEAKAKAKAEKAAAAKAAADLKAKQEADKKLAEQQAATAKNDQAAAEKAALATKPVPLPPMAAVTNNYAGKDLGMKQISAPPLPISASKVERLQALLEKYKADQLTPDEYHQQRAAILAEP
jgi:hypothetical protein